MRSLVLSLALVLSACGGGGDSQPVQVDGYGDSTTEGLTNLVTPVGAVFNNRGISATSITDLISAWDSEAARPARLITVNHAINSVNTLGDPISADEYRSQLTEFVHLAQAEGKRVILETPNPTPPGGIYSHQMDPAKLQALAQIVREVSTATGSPLCDQYSAINTAGMGTLEFIPDGIHPSPRMYQFKAAYLAACIAANL